MIDIIILIDKKNCNLNKVLSSITSQICIPNINVYILDNNSNINYIKEIELYDNYFNIKYIDNIKNNIKDYGLELSKSKYIVFLNTNITFFDSMSLSKLYDYINNNKFDVVLSNFYCINNNYVIDKDTTIFGKIFRSEFINNNNIKFDNGLFNENLGFNYLLRINNAKEFLIDENLFLCLNKIPFNVKNHSHDMFKLMKKFSSDGYNSLIFKKMCINCIIDLFNYNVLSNDEEFNKKLRKYAKEICEILSEIVNYKLDEFLLEKDIKNKYSFNKIKNSLKWSFDYDCTSIKDKYEADVSCNFNDDEYEKERFKHLSILYEYNFTNPSDIDKRNKLKKEIFSSIGENTQIVSPFYSSWGGKNIYLGSECFINANVSMIDDEKIIIGNNSLIGPSVTISTVNHPIEKMLRKQKNIYIKPIIIGDNVWIGANSVIMPGITIGDNSIIGAGSIVTKNIPSNVIAYGNPCRIIKKFD